LSLRIFIFLGVNAILAIDVGAKDDDNFTNYGDELSGWWLLWKKWNHWLVLIMITKTLESRILSKKILNFFKGDSS